jgi:acyl-homoserine-lactone acylase
MQRSLRTVILLLTFPLLCVEPCTAQITVYRDKYGIPSIHADKLLDALYGLGYVMVQDNVDRMARNYKQARGRMGEVDGKGELLKDGFIRSMGIEERAEKFRTELKPEQKALMTSFVDGANQSLKDMKGKVPTWIEPFKLADVLALAQLVNVAFPLQDIAAQLLPSAGSNQFAVGAKRSANGHAILSADPHLPWTGILAWYEFSIYSKEFNFHGITLPGLPFGAMGHTDHVSWSMTNNNPKLFTFYEVKIDPANPRRYNYHGEWKEFEPISFDLKYIEDGQMKTQKQSTRRTLWGPMIPFSTRSVKLLSYEDTTFLDQPIKMARAKDATEFRETLRGRGISMWNIVYADTKGNIGYQYNARLAKRDPSFDWNKNVPGADPKTKWGELWDIDDLPHVENPKSSLIIQANSDPHDAPQGDEINKTWPEYVTSYGPTTRYQGLARQLSTDHSVSVANAMRYATDTLVPHALATLRAMRPQGRQTQADPDLQAATAVLGRWGGRADINARGCGLYLYWLLADKGNPALARRADTGPAWTAEDRTKATESLKRAVEQMKKDHGRLDLTWGEIHVTERGGKSRGIIGLAYFAPGDATATVAPNFGTFKNGKITCIGGSSFRMITDLDPKGIRSWSILPYGDSHDPSNPHFNDQMELFSQGYYKDTLFGLDRIRKGAVSKVELSRK